ASLTRIASSPKSAFFIRSSACFSRAARFSMVRRNSSPPRLILDPIQDLIQDRIREPDRCEQSDPRRDAGNEFLIAVHGKSPTVSLTIGLFSFTRIMPVSTDHARTQSFSRA